MTPKKYDKEKLLKSLENNWYSEKEIEKIMLWVDDLENDRIYTAEEVYKFLFSRKKVYELV